MNNRDRYYEFVVRRPFGTVENIFKKDSTFKAIVRPMVKELKEYFAIQPEGETDFTVIPCVNIKFKEEEAEVNDI